MAPLHIEIFHPEYKEWLRVGKVHPTDPPGSISDNKPDGKRDLYQFECEKDDSKSTIYRSGLGVDMEVGTRFREAIIDPSKLEIVKELKKGESFEMDVKSDKSPTSRKIRFTHNNEI